MIQSWKMFKANIGAKLFAVKSTLGIHEKPTQGLGHKLADKIELQYKRKINEFLCFAEYG